MQVEKVDVKEIERIVEKNYGAKIDLSKYNAYINKEGKIFLSSKGIEKKLIEISTRIGIYFGKIKRNEKIQLSVEGSQIVGKNATKNVAILDEKNIYKFMEGLSVVPAKLLKCEEHNFVIVSNGKDFFGSGIYSNGEIRSMVSKGRRIYTSIRKI